MKKFLTLVLIFILIMPSVSCALTFSTAPNLSAPEREAILRRIIDRCKGTEEAVSAYWDLADLYLDAFPDEMRQEAREMLELCLKNYPDSQRALMIKCKLTELYDTADPRRAELVKEIKNDKTLPNILRASLK